MGARRTVGSGCIPPSAIRSGMTPKWGTAATSPLQPSFRTMRAATADRIEPEPTRRSEAGSEAPRHA